MVEEGEQQDKKPYKTLLIDSIVSNDTRSAREYLVEANSNLVSGGKGGHFGNIEEGGTVDDFLAEVAQQIDDEFVDEFQETVYLGDGMHRLSIYIDKEDPKRSDVYLEHSLEPLPRVKEKWEEMNRV